MATRKILMLHGYSQSAAIFSKRMGAIRKSCGKDIDFVFVDAPHILHPVDVAPTGAANQSLDLPNTTPQPTDPSELPRGWWRANADKTKYWGVEESVTKLRDLLVKDRYEGVFGFSQGAAMAALLCALLERPTFHAPFLVDGHPPHPPMKFCVAVSGFKPLDTSWAPLFEKPFSTPTLHVLGTNDVVVIPERGRTLVDVSAGARVVMHDGGHFVPSKTNWRTFFRDYLADPLGDVPAPGVSTGTATPLATGSLPASGISTPAKRLSGSHLIPSSAVDTAAASLGAKTGGGEAKGDGEVKL